MKRTLAAFLPIHLSKEATLLLARELLNLELVVWKKKTLNYTSGWKNLVMTNYIDGLYNKKSKDHYIFPESYINMF